MHEQYSAEMVTLLPHSHSHVAEIMPPVTAGTDCPRLHAMDALADAFSFPLNLTLVNASFLNFYHFQ